MQRIFKKDDNLFLKLYFSKLAVYHLRYLKTRKHMNSNTRHLISQKLPNIFYPRMTGPKK